MTQVKTNTVFLPQLGKCTLLLWLNEMAHWPKINKDVYGYGYQMCEASEFSKTSEHRTIMYKQARKLQATPVRNSAQRPTH